MSLLALSILAVAPCSGGHLATAPQPLPIPAKSITWSDEDWTSALQRAQAEKMVVFLAVNMDGERANEAMLEVYEDKGVVKASQLTINLIASASVHAKQGKKCPRFGCSDCDVHRSIESDARDQMSEAGKGDVIAPQHIWFSSDGAVLLSVPYAIQESELIWCTYTALAENDPEFEAPMPSGARPPKRLVRGGVAESIKMDQAPSREEALELLKEVKKGGRGAGGRQVEIVRRLLLADEPEVIEWFKTYMRGTRAGRGFGGGGGPGGGGRGGGEDEGERRDRRADVLHAMGTKSPPAFWEVVIEHIDNSNDSMRDEAIVALEQLAAPESLKELRSALSKSRETAVTKNLLRAYAAAGYADKRVKREVLKRAKKDKDGVVRRNAIVSLGYLEPDEDVTALLGSLLDAGDPDDRAAAAVAMSLSREKAWLEKLKAVGEKEAEDRVIKAACEGAAQALESGEMVKVKLSWNRATEDEIARERLFGTSRGDD